MIKVTFDKKLTEQFENYGEVLKWISDELTATSTSENSDDRVKLELLTQEELDFLSDDQKRVWAEVLEEYSPFDYAVFYNDFTFLDIIRSIDSLTYYDVLSYLDDCEILNLFKITED